MELNDKICHLDWGEKILAVTECVYVLFYNDL